MRTNPRIILLLAAGIACSSVRPPTVHGVDANRSTTATDSAIRELAALPGEIREYDGGFSFGIPREHDAILERLIELDTLAMPRLVECVGDPALAAITFKGVRAPVAVLCSIALMNLPFIATLRRRSDWTEECEDAIGALSYDTAGREARMRTFAAWKAVLAALRQNAPLSCVG